MSDDVSGATARRPAIPPGWQGSLVAGAHALENAIGMCNRGVLLLTGLFLLALLNVIVFLRYTGSIGIDSGAELTALVFPFFVIAGIVEAARTGAHVATQILINALGQNWRRWLVIFIHSVTAAAYLYLTWYAFQNAIIAHDEQSTILRVPGSVGYGCLAAGMCLVGICSLTAIVRHALGAEDVVINLADSGPGVV
jgi:TRAP-type C4-dicarboxylate transport system permease small subunit